MYFLFTLSTTTYIISYAHNLSLRYVFPSSALMRHPDRCPALVLKADYPPLSYYPLSLWPWQTAIKAAFLERVDIIAEYDREIHSPSCTMRITSLIALRQYIRPATHPAFTRFTLFLRDRFRCHARKNVV